MQMQHVGPLDGGIEYAEERVHGRLDDPCSRAPEISQRDALPFAAAALARVVSAPLHDLHVAAEPRKQRIEPASVRFDAALHVDDATQPEHHDAQTRLSCGRACVYGHSTPKRL